MKKLFLAAAVLLCMPVFLDAQIRPYLTGTVDYSYFANTDNTTKNHSLKFLPALGIAIGDNWTVEVGVGYGIERLVIDGYNYWYHGITPGNTHTFIIRPAAAYRVRISDKFSYLPGIYQSTEFLRQGKERNKTFTAGLDFAKFEFNPNRNIGILLSMGDASFNWYQHRKSNDDDFKLNNKLINVSFADNFRLGFRYYFN